MVPGACPPRPQVEGTVSGYPERLLRHSLVPTAAYEPRHHAAFGTKRHLILAAIRYQLGEECPGIAGRWIRREINKRAAPLRMLVHDAPAEAPQFRTAEAHLSGARRLCAARDYPEPRRLLHCTSREIFYQAQGALPCWFVAVGQKHNSTNRLRARKVRQTLSAAAFQASPDLIAQRTAAGQEPSSFGIAGRRRRRQFHRSSCSHSAWLCGSRSRCNPSISTSGRPASCTRTSLPWTQTRKLEPWAGRTVIRAAATGTGVADALIA